MEELADNVHAAAVASIAAASRTASPARALLPHANVSGQYWEATGLNVAGQHRAGGGDQTVLAVAGLEHQANSHFLEGNSMLLDKYRQAKAEMRRSVLELPPEVLMCYQGCLLQVQPKCLSQ